MLCCEGMLRGTRRIKDLRRALERPFRERLAVAVCEGELPENANVQSMSPLVWVSIRWGPRKGAGGPLLFLRS